MYIHTHPVVVDWSRYHDAMHPRHTASIHVNTYTYTFIYTHTLTHTPCCR